MAGHAIQGLEVAVLFIISQLLKGTGSPDGLGFSWHIWIDLGLKKGRGWLLNFIGAPPIVH